MMLSLVSSCLIFCPLRNSFYTSLLMNICILISQSWKLLRLLCSLRIFLFLIKNTFFAEMSEEIVTITRKVSPSRSMMNSQLRIDLYRIKTCFQEPSYSYVTDFCNKTCFFTPSYVLESRKHPYRKEA